ncbi:hypothetical protein ABN763_12505 [Spongiivirga sp. MCCC 1A20706]|uniref:hypothetical protein n=1 Tax=Spongiivirga sp. MCCC 1A20706 TaxID=3160963 RepID=UPI00397784C3
MTRKRSVIISLVSMTFLLVLYGLTTSGIMGFNPVGEEGGYGAPLVVPSGYAFTIWAPIYLFLIAFPIYQYFKKAKESNHWNTLRNWYSINVLANGFWLVGAAYEWLWITVFLIVILLISLYQINVLLLNIWKSGYTINFFAERVGFRIYFGWITLATALNISAALKFYEWDGFGLSETNWSLIILSVAATLAGLTFWKFRSVTYALVVIWAFGGLVHKHINENHLITYLSVTVMITFVLLILVRTKLLKTKIRTLQNV